jgi:hypothetical protein
MLHAVSLLLGMINTYAGIAFHVLLQLNLAIARRIRPLNWF